MKGLSTSMTPVDEAYTFCRDVVRRARENFPIVWPGMSLDQRRALFALYAFLRTADDLVDLPGVGLETRLQGLMKWEGMLKAAYREPPHHPVFIALHDAIRRFELEESLLTRPLEAFKVDLFKHRYRSHAELLEYCDMSANSIGEMMLCLFGYRHHSQWSTLLKSSDALCTALQLINHWQHVFRDRRLNRLYLPMDDMAASGYAVEQWQAGDCSPEFEAVMRMQFRRIQELLNESTPIFRSVKGALRWYLRATWWSARRLLNKLVQHDYGLELDGPTLGLTDRLWIGSRLGRNPA